MGTIAVTTLAVWWYTLPMLRTHTLLSAVLSPSRSLFPIEWPCARSPSSRSPMLYTYTRSRLLSTYTRTCIHTIYIYIYILCVYVRYTGLRVTTTRLSISPLFSASSLPRLCVKRRGLGGSLLPWTGAKARTENRDRAIY